jgi:hypothetical protein
MLPAMETPEQNSQDWRSMSKGRDLSACALPRSTTTRPTVLPWAGGQAPERHWVGGWDRG